jgi:hypothetical protein
MNKLTKEQLNVDPTAKVGLARRRMKLPSSRSRRKAEEDKDERERAGADKAKFDPELISLGNRAEIMAALYSASIVQAAGKCTQLPVRTGLRSFDCMMTVTMDYGREDRNLATRHG